MSCVTRFQVLRGTTVQRNAFTPLTGELIFDTTLNQMFVGDGATAGGVPISSSQSLIVAQTSTNLTLTNQDFIRVVGASPVTITVPPSSKRITIKNSSTAIVTIVPDSGTINDEPSLQIKGTGSGKLGNSIDLIYQGGQFWVV